MRTAEARSVIREDPEYVNLIFCKRSQTRVKIMREGDCESRLWETILKVRAIDM